MAKVSMKELLESGVHFGHRTHRWNPYMKPYIFTERNGIHIIDLQQTSKELNKNHEMIVNKVAEGRTILFVGTKRQAQETIMEEAQRCGMPYVTVRWLGGMLTNWNTMRQRIQELDRLERMREQGDFEKLTKKEGLMLSRKIEKLEARFGGVRKMHRLPDMLFIVDIRREETAVKEANVLNIPIVALVDTNCDPRNIDHVIPSNDDAIRAIKLMVGNVADAVLEGKAMRQEDEDEEQVAQAPMVDLGEELTDEELLGAATLAKMEAQAVEEETVDAVVEETADSEVEDKPKAKAKAKTTAKKKEEKTEKDQDEAEAKD